jgi:hypothetical protein
MAVVPQFQKAKRESCKASIMIEGLPGSGKSGLALCIGYALSNRDWSKVFHIDTENDSALLFEGILADNGEPFGEFMHGVLDADIGFAPSNFLAYRKAAVQQGALTVIEDSISHAWSYKGGVLDLVSIAKAGSARYAKDSYAAWGDESVVKEKNELLELIRSSKCHVITTVRVKERFEYGTDAATGKSQLISMGEQQIQQADLKYEPDLVLQMITPGSNKGGVVIHPRAIVVKTRYAIFNKGEAYDFTPALLEQLRAYLAEGVDPLVLLEMQRVEYANAVKSYLDAHSGAVTIWKVLKQDAGYGETKLDDMPLDVLKALYIKITS